MSQDRSRPDCDWSVIEWGPVYKRMLHSGAEALLEYPVFVKTVTLYYTGILRRITSKEIVLTCAAWIPTTGRWATVLVEGATTIPEVEPYPSDMPVVVNRDTIVEILPWPFILPTTQK